MRLNTRELANREQWTKAGFTLPVFNRDAAAAETRSKPTWIHFGAGNIFRAFPALRQQELLDAGIEKTGIIVAEGYDYEIIDTVFAPHDNLGLAVTLKSDGGIDKAVVASVVEALKADPVHPDFLRLAEAFRAPTLQLVSFTITEKGYSLLRNGATAPDAADDFAAGPAAPRSYIGKLAALLYGRFLAGRFPLALVSMDNCSRNGEKLYDAVRAFALEWSRNGLVDKGFLPYVESPDAVSFPWTMIDKITPGPDAGVRQRLLAAGFEDVEIKVTEKFTHVAPFVNAEETEYLVIEDRFPNGRPALEKAGVLFCDRATVDRAEKMKVCTCLNPLHTAMSIYGCLLAYDRVFDAMRDPAIRRLVEVLGYDEGLPVAADPGVIRPREFLDTCFQVRWANPFMPDTPQRIALDTSQKMPIRFGETVRIHMERPDLDVAGLTAIPLVHAGWCRYLMGIDDTGGMFEPSPDPMLDRLRSHFEGLRLGDKGPFHKRLCPLLSDARLFGVNLYEAGLGGKVECQFAELIAGPGAVRATLEKYLPHTRFPASCTARPTDYPFPSTPSTNPPRGGARMLTNFEHVGVACSDIDKSVEFYRDLLGMKVLQYEKTAEGATVVLLDAGGGGLELVANPGIKDTPAPQLPKTSAGIMHFSFAVSDLASLYDFLRGKGVEFTVQPRKPKVMKNCTGIAFCKDPDGNLVEFIERPPQGG